MGQHVANAVTVRLEGLRQALERRQPAAPRPADPAVHQQQHRHLRAPTPGNDVAQTFLQTPGARGLEAGVTQPMQID